MFTNQLKRGDRIQLRNGWYATILDNKNGNVRMVQVEGYYTETGSCYAWDIVSYIPDPIGAIHIRTPIEHTPAQLKRERDVSQLLSFPVYGG